MCRTRKILIAFPFFAASTIALAYSCPRVCSGYKYSLKHFANDVTYTEPFFSDKAIHQKQLRKPITQHSSQTKKKSS